MSNTSTPPKFDFCEKGCGGCPCITAIHDYYGQLIGYKCAFNIDNPVLDRIIEVATKMSPVADTSLLTWQQILPKLPQKRSEVYSILSEATRNGFDMTLFEVAAALHRPDHWVSGRFTELKKDKLIFKTEKRKNPKSG